MRIQIGLRHGGGLLSYELDQDPDQFVASLERAQAAGTPLDLTDSKGDRTLIPYDSIAYVNMPADRDVRVGFARA